MLKLVIVLMSFSFNVMAESGSELIFDKVATYDGFKTSTQNIGNEIYKGLAANPQTKQLGIFLKYNLEKYQVYDFVKFVSAIESKNSDLASVLYWHESSRVAQRLHLEALTARQLTTQQVEMSVMQFAQENLTSMSEQRKDKIVRIMENEKSLETGVATALIVYELTNALRGKVGRQLASVNEATNDQMMQLISSTVTQQIFIATAYRLRNLDEKELDEYLVFTGTQGSKNYHSIRSKNMIQAFAHTLKKALYKYESLSPNELRSEVNI